MRAPAGLHLDYLSPAEYLSAPRAEVLGVAAFSGPPNRPGGSTSNPAVTAPVVAIDASINLADQCYWLNRAA